ncbi:MAG: NYN domain-containing protein [Actinobacteria bacterium]|nr:NYN domain-containing protein [Actinomycetota bacterium]
MARWLVDGSNVVGSRPDGWWRDRGGAFAALAVELTRFAEATGDEVAVVFDGKAPEPYEDEDGVGVPVHWAPSADDRIVALVVADADPASLSVVTSDRQLAERVSARGATTTGTGSFRRRLDALGRG